MAVKRAVKSTKDTIAENVKAPSSIYRAIYSSSTEEDDYEIPVSPANSPPRLESQLENGKLQSPDKFSAPKINKTTRPPMLLIVSTAIKEVGTERKGASVQAIRKWILGNYTDIDQSRLKVSLKKALDKGIQTGVLGRPLNSVESSGATGSFKLMKKNTEVKEAKATKKSKAKPESQQLHSSDSSEPITKKIKKPSTNSKKTLKQTKPKKIKSVPSDNAELQNEIKSASSDTEITAPQTRKKLVQKASKSDTDVDDQVETKPKRAQKKPTVKPKRTAAPAAKPGPSSSKTNKAVKPKATVQKSKSQNSD